MSVPDADILSFDSVVAKVNEAYLDESKGDLRSAYEFCPMHLCDGMLSKILWFRNEIELSPEQIKTIYEKVLTIKQRQIIVNTVNSKDANVRFWWLD